MDTLLGVILALLGGMAALAFVLGVRTFGGRSLSIMCSVIFLPGVSVAGTCQALNCQYANFAPLMLNNLSCPFLVTGGVRCRVSKLSTYLQSSSSVVTADGNGLRFLPYDKNGVSGGFCKITAWSDFLVSGLSFGYPSIADGRNARNI